MGGGIEDGFLYLISKESVVIMLVSKTVIMSCAGMGTRLGMGMPKALLEFHGKKLIEWQLEQLNEIDDLRVVIGYKKEEVQAVVAKKRPDAIFIEQDNYATGGTASSFTGGVLHKPTHDIVVSLDGDLLVHPDDFNNFFNINTPCIGITKITSQCPIYANTINLDGVKMINSFSTDHGRYEWSGLAQMKRKDIALSKGHVYQILENLLPLPSIYIRCAEVDTPSDYENALVWVKENLIDKKID